MWREKKTVDNSDNIKLVKSYVYNDAIGMSEGGTEDDSYETNSGERLYLGVDADTALGKFVCVTKENP